MSYDVFPLYKIRIKCIKWYGGSCGGYAVKYKLLDTAFEYDFDSDISLTHRFYKRLLW